MARIMEKDEEQKEKPKEKMMTRAQTEEKQEELIHHHKQAIACLIETSNWRQDMCLRDLKKCTRELLAGTDVVMENEVFNAALKLVEGEIMLSANMVERGISINRELNMKTVN